MYPHYRSDIDRHLAECSSRIQKLKEEALQSQVPRRFYLDTASTQDTDDFPDMKELKSFPNVKTSLLQSVGKIEELLEW